MDAEARALFSRPWAIEPHHGRALIESLADVSRARASGIEPEKREPSTPAADVNGVRVLTMRGPMLHRPAAWLAEWGIEYTDTLGLARQVIEADADQSVKEIRIIADTPGGMVGGVPELADAIAGCKKPVKVSVDGMLASAGVWAAASADEITATRSSEVGSIGVYTVRVDTSQALAERGIKVHLVSSGGVKGHGADGRVTDALLAEDARIIAQLRDQFVAAVSAGRGRDMSSRATGQVWLAHDAERIGLIDSITGCGTVPAPTPTNEDSMDLSPLAALAAKHPTKAADILKMAADGKTDGEIAAALADQAHADAVTAAKAEAEQAKADKAKALADLDAAKAESDKLRADLKAAQEQAGKVAALVVAAPTDPGPDGAEKPMSRAAFQALSPRDRAALVAKHGVEILSTLTP